MFLTFEFVLEVSVSGLEIVELWFNCLWERSWLNIEVLDSFGVLRDNNIESFFNHVIQIQEFPILEEPLSKLLCEFRVHMD